jgi:hypothetical protein
VSAQGLETHEVTWKSERVSLGIVFVKVDMSWN